jgi:hypothetical protein
MQGTTNDRRRSTLLAFWHGNVQALARRIEDIDAIISRVMRQAGT